MDATAFRGLDKGHFRLFLQCWALLQMEPLYKVAQEIAPTLSRPNSEVVRSQQVQSPDTLARRLPCLKPALPRELPLSGLALSKYPCCTSFAWLVPAFR